MATTDYWADAPMNREQISLFAPTLDAMISEDDSVRLFDEVLGMVDWTEWEGEFPHMRGQPPIHPRHVAAALLYGLYRGIRSTRKFEEACRYRLDFIWLVSGRQIDHSTFNKFRTRFKKPLKRLFRQIGRIAMDLGLIKLGAVAFDGTRVKASNGRYETRTAKTLEEKLRLLDELYEQMMADAEKVEAEQLTLEGEEASPTRLPDELADLEKRRKKIREALAQAKVADEARQENGMNPEKNPAQVPMTDADSRVMPNKEGGYAPNYTPTATTDAECGFIVDCDVIAQTSESSLLGPSVERIAETFGQYPEKMLTDGGNNHGQIMQEMEQLGVEFYAPAESTQPVEGNPAKREDPTQPVPESEWANLPRNDKGQIDKSCFVYDSAQDQYYCPMGEVLPFDKTKPDERHGVKVTKRIYRCDACAGCPLATACLSKRSKGNRTITRDEFEEVRQRTAQRMASEEGRKLYNQRPRIAETTFGILKTVMGLRQFLLRGLEKVKTEWRWAATAFNIMKLVRHLARLRAQSAESAALPGG